MRLLAKLLMFLAFSSLLSCQSDTAQLATQQLQKMFSKTFQSESISFADFSPDGQQIIIGSTFEKLHSWPINAPEKMTTLSFDGELIALRYLGKKDSIFFANNLGVSQFLNDKLKPQGKGVHFSGVAKRSVASNDLSLIVFGEYIYNSEQGKILKFNLNHAVQTSLQLSDKNTILSAGYQDAHIVLSDTLGKTLVDWQLDNPVVSTAIRKDGSFVVASTDNGNCYVWKIPNKKPVHRCDERTAAMAIHFNEPGDRFVLVMENQVTSYQMAPFKKIFSQAFDGSIRTSRIAAKNWLAIGTDEGEVSLWDIASGQLLAIENPAQGRINTIALDPQQKLLALGTYNGHVAIYRVKE